MAQVPGGVEGGDGDGPCGGGVDLVAGGGVAGGRSGGAGGGDEPVVPVRSSPDTPSPAPSAGGGLSRGLTWFLAAAGGAAGMAALVAGMLLLDAAVQAGQVANQARIFALRPQARARLNTAYMTCSFLGGSAGSWLGVRAYEWFGWRGVCDLVAVLAVVVLARHVLRRRPVPALAAGVEPEADAAPGVDGPVGGAVSGGPAGRGSRASSR